MLHELSKNEVRFRMHAFPLKNCAELASFPLCFGSRSSAIEGQATLQLSNSTRQKSREFWRNLIKYSLFRWLLVFLSLLYQNCAEKLPKFVVFLRFTVLFSFHSWSVFLQRRNSVYVWRRNLIGWNFDCYPYMDELMNINEAIIATRLRTVSNYHVCFGVILFIEPRFDRHNV